MITYEATIGLEVHVQIKTHSKMFCGCKNEFGASPNTHTCPVCLGMPGVLPVPNEEAIRKTLLTGLMLGCKIPETSKFDRKSYFYPDMPKNYQISQYDRPLCLEGGVVLEKYAFPKETQKEAIALTNKKVRLTRIHLEEDVAKSFHFETSSGIDFNRAGTPLMEIVTEADIASPEEAFAFLTTLKQILIYGGISDADMEKGQLRCDCNVSVRPQGTFQFGTKCEIKNMNSISGVRRALAYEIQRQIEVLQEGGTIRQETRRWDDPTGQTYVMRTKEQSHDYRYFPDPDLMPMRVEEKWLSEIRTQMPELPRQRQERYQSQFQVTEYDASVLASDLALATYFEKAAEGVKNPKLVANWIINDLLSALSDKKLNLSDCKVKPEFVKELVSLTDSGKINSKQAKEVFLEMFESGLSPSQIVEKKGLSQVSDAGAIEKFAKKAIEANPNSVADYKAGKAAALNFLKGQVMKLSQGKANPQMAGEVLERLLKA
jgi:aspartyl-tRNA(Asn)/glutamyl-tRNA(Gln) amidotransferase subunit B